MDDLALWLGAQLDLDQRDAEARRGIFPSPGVQDDGAIWLHVRPGGNAAIVWRREPAEGWDDMAKLKAWASAENGWTQERVLLEIDAKRRILAEHSLNGWVCDTCDNGEVEQVFPCPTQRLLALPYADRPGYREEWQP